MKKKIIVMISMLCLAGVFSAGCGGGNSVNTQEDVRGEADVAGKDGAQGNDDAQQTDAVELADGVYTAEFHTDSSMFHVNEAYDGKGTLTVEDGKMVIHISLTSKNIVNLYPGLAKDAKKEGAVLLQPTVDSVTYSDGFTEEVHGFDVPVPALEEEFDLALIGTKGVWYDHKVYVTAPVPSEKGVSGEPADQADVRGEADVAGKDSAQGNNDAQQTDAAELADGVYTVELTFEGGSGKAQILSPAVVTADDGKLTATLEWNSPNYDYMIVDGEKYLPVNTEGNAVFEIPVPAFDKVFTVIGDTVAMSKPHEIEYSITFHSESCTKK